MTEKKRPTAKNILNGIVQAMIDAQEPLDDDLALVPANYEVYIHPRAYQELQSLMPRIKEQVRKRLDQELDRLNSRRSGGQGLFKRLFFPLTRLLFADRYFQQDVRPITYERSGETWYVDFSVTAEPDAEIDYLVVESDFGLQKQPKYKGRPTINILRRTTMQPDGRFETVISAKRPRKGRVRERGARATYAPTPAVPSTDVLARLPRSRTRPFWGRLALMTVSKRPSACIVVRRRMLMVGRPLYLGCFCKPKSDSTTR